MMDASTSSLNDAEDRAVNRPDDSGIYSNAHIFLQQYPTNSGFYGFCCLGISLNLFGSFTNKDSIGRAPVRNFCEA